MIKLSIVATLYQSAPYIEEFYKRASISAREVVGESYEIVLVNDGSPDNSLELAINFTKNDKTAIVIDLSRNFGHHKAMMTGLAHASGELIFLIDSDLEEEPEWLLSFDKQMRAEDCDVVYGIQVKRKGGFFEKITGSLFYKIYQIFTSISLPNNPTTARLMTRRYVEALLLHKEREVIIAPLWAITGFIQSQQVVYKKSHSPTTYSISRRISLLVNAIISFSSLPLVFTFYSGLFIFISALFVILFYLIKYFTISLIPSGYTSIILSIWLFSGLIIFFLGVQGIYISTVFSEVKKRPYTIIRQIYQNTND